MDIIFHTYPVSKKIS